MFLMQSAPTLHSRTIHLHIPSPSTVCEIILLNTQHCLHLGYSCKSSWFWQAGYIIPCCCSKPWGYNTSSVLAHHRGKRKNCLLYFHQQKQQAKLTHHLCCPEAEKLSSHEIDKGQIDLSEAGVPAAEELKEHKDRHLPQALLPWVSPQNALSDPSVLHLCPSLVLQSLVRGSQSTHIPLKAALQLPLDTETHQGAAVIRYGPVREERKGRSPSVLDFLLLKPFCLKSHFYSLILSPDSCSQSSALIKIQFPSK